MLLTQLPRATKALLATAILITTFTIVHLTGLPWQTSLQTLTGASGGTRNVQAANNHEDISSYAADRLPCQTLRGGEDVLVVMRTGATEIKDKLPVHLNTTFQCYKNLVIFSDYAETFGGHQVHDVLKDVAVDIKVSNKDFRHYQHVLKVGRENLSEEELSGAVSQESGPGGKTDNAGWRLDKWKFLPMINATYGMYPHLKWYVFVEPDTYIVWSNMLQWLSGMDSTKPGYFGSEVMVGSDVFAHGGSAFVLSAAALEIGAQTYQQHTRDLWEYTAGHWAGDCVLGVALRDAGVPLTWSWPMFQGGNPALMDWTEAKGDDHRLWCLPALSYHHLVPEEKRRLFEFEQDWIRKRASGALIGDASGLTISEASDTILHHRDLYKNYVRPELEPQKQAWNNFPETNWTGIDVPDCREYCEKDSECLQYAVYPDGLCATGTRFRLGQAAAEIHSGWMVDRIDAWAKKMDSQCPRKNTWTIP